jgi:hypothetical protein
MVEKMAKRFSLKRYINGQEQKLGDEEDFHKRKFFDTRQEAEQAKAYYEDIRRGEPGIEITIVEFDFDPEKRVASRLAEHPDS